MPNLTWLDVTTDDTFLRSGRPGHVGHAGHVRVARVEGRDLFRIVPHRRRSFRLERRDGAFWWPLLGERRGKYGVPLPRTWRTPDGAMRAATALYRATVRASVRPADRAA